MAPCMEQNPVTGVKEPHFPKQDRLSRILTGSMAIIIMVMGGWGGIGVSNLPAPWPAAPLGSPLLTYFTTKPL